MIFCQFGSGMSKIIIFFVILRKFEVLLQEHSEFSSVCHVNHHHLYQVSSYNTVFVSITHFEYRMITTSEYRMFAQYHMESSHISHALWSVDIPDPSSMEWNTVDSLWYQPHPWRSQIWRSDQDTEFQHIVVLIV